MEDGVVEPLPSFGVGLAGVGVDGVGLGPVAGFWLMVSVTAGSESSPLQAAMAAASNRAALAAKCGARTLLLCPTRLSLVARTRLH
jgi:hypothetical protein